LLYGFTLGDLLGVTPVHLPTQYLSGRTRKVLTLLTAGGLVLTLVGTVLLFAWGELQTVWDWQQVPPQEPVNSAISVAVAALMGLLLIGATALGGWAVFIGQGSLLVLGMGALLIALILVRLACKLLVVLLARLALVPCAVVDLPAAGIGKRIWDWGCEFSLAARPRCRAARL